MLSVFAVLLLGANLVLGLSIGDVQSVVTKLLEAQRNFTELQKSSDATPAEIEAALQQRTAIAKRFAPMQEKMGVHRLLGIAAALVALLVNCITVTYFIGTSRWCQEVVDTYSLNDDLAQASRQHKRRAFPWALGGIMTILLIAALGAVADPAGLNAGPRWTMAHFWSAMLGVAFIAWSFVMQAGSIGGNYQVIEQILAEVNRRRAATAEAGRAGEGRAEVSS